MPDPPPAASLDPAGVGVAPELPLAMSAGSGATAWPALLDHVRQLAQAGLPLPQAMRQIARDAAHPRMRAELDGLATRIESGQSLSDAVAAGRLPLRDPLAAALEAGSRTGDLWAVLTPLMQTAQTAAFLRSGYRRVVWYALGCIAAAIGLMALIIGTMRQVLAAASESLLAGTPSAGYAVTEINPPVVALLAIPASLLVVILFDALMRLRSRDRLPLQMIPPMSGLAAQQGWFRWASILRTLIGSGVALPDALRLAGRSAMHRTVGRESETLAGAVERGEPIAAAIRGASAPLLIRSLIATSDAPAGDSIDSGGDPRGGDGLTDALGESAAFLSEAIEARTARTTQLFRVATVLILGCGAMGYMLLALGPMFDLYIRIATPLVQ